MKRYICEMVVDAFEVTAIQQIGTKIFAGGREELNVVAVQPTSRVRTGDILAKLPDSRYVAIPADVFAALFVEAEEA